MTLLNDDTEYLLQPFFRNYTQFSFYFTYKTILFNILFLIFNLINLIIIIFLFKNFPSDKDKFKNI